MSRVVLFALFCIARVHAVAHYQFTTVVGAGMRECFYQPVLKGMDLEVIFDVRMNKFYFKYLSLNHLISTNHPLAIYRLVSTQNVSMIKIYGS